MPIRRFCPALLLVVLLLPGRLVQAQDNEIITVTGLYSSSPQGEYREILTPCDSFEVWNVGTQTAAFTTLAQVYASVKDALLFVELRGRYTAYEGKSHSDGVFEITEFVRHSTDPADLRSCGSECEDVFGTSADVCIDGQCGSTRNSCVAGDYFDHDEGSLADTATEYRWMCGGSYGGDGAICTAPKGPLPPDGGLRLGPEHLYHRHGQR